MDVTKAAQDGYEGGSSPFILTSPNDMAWRAGGWCYHNQVGRPTKVTTGRGYKINVTTQRGSCDTFRAVLDFGTDSKVPARIA